jgi:hypothetical protein
MNITSHDLIRVLIFGIPVLLIGVWAWSQRRRAKDNAEISAILRDRKP